MNWYGTDRRTRANSNNDNPENTNFSVNQPQNHRQVHLQKEIDCMPATRLNKKQMLNQLRSAKNGPMN